MAPSRLITYRQLGPRDIEPMRDLLGVFGDAFKEPETYCRAQPIDDYLERLLGSNSFIALAAFEGDRVIGGIAAYELRKFEQERSEIYLYDLAVAATHRRLGVATGLIEELKRIARDRGAWVVYVQADLGDNAAIALYSKHGVREDVLHFDLGLD